MSPFAAPRPPWRAGEAETASRREIEVIVARAVPVGAAATLAVVQEIALLATYEPKCTTISLHPTAAGRGRYETAGRLGGVVRWRGWFDYALDDTGFYSHTTTPIGGVAVAGGFRVESRAEGASVVTHYEQYLLPVGTRWLRPLLRRYVVRTMHAELSAIAALAGQIARLPEPRIEILGELRIAHLNQSVIR
ncbi:MAG: hypothetical protein H0W70_05770 [Actinobacteria bacterium]|nr:hypothetical protein [Actinomycetota bacterium]